MSIIPRIVSTPRISIPQCETLVSDL
ncbi:hypothetical protein RHCRD62_80095 [Rhodococcus sp. RD6.2]|nr:hypothetical protein RHCRD62_80095 [Rhodococcus sp. RD6.2]